MIVNVAGGTVSFRRYISLGVVGAIPGGADADPGQRTLAMLSDASVNPTHVSLQCPAVRIAAAEFTITAMGNIRKVGWVNIIQASDRRYHYERGPEVIERVNDLPTWDGGNDGQAPFYFGSWYGTDADAHEDGVDGCCGILTVDNEEDVIFNDAPCMPPSYNVFNSNGIALGKFNFSPPGFEPNYMTRISGADRYVACLVVVDNANARTVIWEVPWDAQFIARVTRHPTGAPVVAIDAAANTRVNIAPTHAIAGLIAASVAKAGGELQKRYEINRPPQLFRALGLVRTRSTGDLRKLGI